MRSQLDLYRAQHDNCLPPVDSFESFKTNMTTKVGQYGPYVEKILVNPFNNLNTIRFDGEPAGADKAGWRIDTESGLFQSDDSDAHAALQKFNRAKFVVNIEMAGSGLDLQKLYNE